MNTDDLYPPTPAPGFGDGDLPLREDVDDDEAAPPDDRSYDDQAMGKP